MGNWKGRGFDGSNLHRWDGTDTNLTKSGLNVLSIKEDREKINNIGNESIRQSTRTQNVPGSFNPISATKPLCCGFPSEIKVEQS